MRYNLANTTEAEQAFAYVTELVGREAEVEIKRVLASRTLNQNAYLHVLLGGLGNFLGYSMAEIKTVYKRDICPELYVYEAHGTKFLRSSADLSTEEMSKSIDKLRTFAEQQGYPLPAESDIHWIRQLTNELERVQYYL